ncbi:hypothetical protein F511_20024 [Dorcoceras hygrometricum]|uniref:CCHC-type domain-containing protein n=1 Tax=Dorcoceras hygrometricum TaxID=472368 RepID=A0A2Z7A371_9LAMI|nr:hypothetical protein F511_20024 [Dorcoceras hygrometricum]
MSFTKVDTTAFCLRAKVSADGLTMKKPAVVGKSRRKLFTTNDWITSCKHIVTTSWTTRHKHIISPGFKTSVWTTSRENFFPAIAMKFPSMHDDVKLVYVVSHTVAAGTNKTLEEISRHDIALEEISRTTSRQEQRTAARNVARPAGERRRVVAPASGATVRKTSACVGHRAKQRGQRLAVMRDQRASPTCPAARNHARSSAGQHRIVAQQLRWTVASHVRQPHVKQQPRIGSLGQTRVQQSTEQSVDPMPSGTSSSQPSVAPQSLSLQRFRPRGRRFKRSSSSSSCSGGSGGVRTSVSYCGQCGGKHRPSQCVGVRGACNNCGQVGHYAGVCPTLGQLDLTRSSLRRSYRPFQSQRSGFQPSEASGVRDLSLSDQSGLQPTQADATTEERDDVLTGGGCTGSCSLLVNSVVRILFDFFRPDSRIAVFKLHWLSAGCVPSCGVDSRPHDLQLLSAPESFGPPAVELLRHMACFMCLSRGNCESDPSFALNTGGMSGTRP